MKPFVLESSMTTMAGVFYPTGYIVAMFPTEADAGKGAASLASHGFSDEDISLLRPDDIHEKIARTVGNADTPLPSAGTEGDTVRRFAELASKGQYGLMVHAPSGEDGEKVMSALEGMPVSYAQKYRKLVIEDMV